MNIVGIIPARMASSRFPGKPLADICGMPMIGHVYFRSMMSRALNEVYVATCDREIEDYCRKNGMKAVMTKDTHQRASDRAAEAMLKIENESSGRIDIVVMIQGDEPMLMPEMIDLALEPMLNDKSVNIVNLMAGLADEAEEKDPNTVKVVVDKNNCALYFSREPVPSRKKTNEKITLHKQVPIIPFRRDFLIKFNELPPTPLEIIESVDMLRILEHGYRVKMVISHFDTHSVDTPEDLKKVTLLMQRDTLFGSYALKKE